MFHGAAATQEVWRFFSAFVQVDEKFFLSNSFLKHQRLFVNSEQW